MKLKDIFNFLRRAGDKTPKRPPIEKEDMYATIKHHTQMRYIGKRLHGKHNNRKMTKGRRVQYHTANGITKPIYHGAK